MASLSPSAADLAMLQQLYDAGRFPAALAAAQPFGPLEQWRDTDALILAGRLARHLGAGGLGMRLILRAWRHDRGHWRARYHRFWILLDYRGPVTAWRELKHFAVAPDAPVEWRADYCSLKARVLTGLRDFEAAGRALDEGDALGTDRAWLAVERAGWLQAQDRYSESLAAAERGLTAQAWHWACAGVKGHLLTLLNRDEEAVEFLSEAAGRLESSGIVAQLAALQMELGRHAAARENWERYAVLCPLMEKKVREWLATQRSDTAYHCGDFAAAARWAAEAGDNPHYKKFAERLAAPQPEWRRLQLPVGFTRQHQVTCVPATLTTLARFWSQPAEHLAVAEQICYDGTPSHSERNWAEQNGWVAREFKVSLESARQLLERGVPFAFTTVNPANAHEQAVIGCDDLRGSLLVRDPYFRHVVEYHAEKTLEGQQASGPRGMAMVPRARAALLDGLELPEAAFYDLHHEALLALSRHDRPAALAAVERLEAAAPGHRLALQARRAVAHYDANAIEILAQVEKLLALLPKDVNLQLTRLSCLRELGRREERLKILSTLGTGKEADPLYWQEHASELVEDAREHTTALRLLRRARRFRWTDAGALNTEANLLWGQARYPEAVELYFQAACLDDKNERTATAWFNAARFVKQTDAALAFLRRRCEAAGKKSSAPWQTLSWALRQLDRTREAFTVLEEAMKLRPEDGELQLYAASEFGSCGERARAAALLESARGIAPPLAWLRTAAHLAERGGEPQSALTHWRQVLTTAPLAMDAHQAVALLVAETQGRATALEHLRAACERFPHHFPLHQLWLGWLRQDGLEATEPVVRRLVEINPADSWARRELASVLNERHQFDDALRELDLAAQLEPESPALFNIRGAVRAAQDRLAEARADFRESLRRSVDSEFAQRELLRACDTREARQDAIAFLRAELVRQVTFGDGLLTFAEAAAPFLPPEELLTVLRDAHRERPDLWHAWSALAVQLHAQKQPGEALMIVRAATQKFPHLPRLWLDRGRIHRARSELDNAIHAFEQALAINPAWALAARELASVHEAAGNLERAVEVLTRAAQLSPLDAITHGFLAEALWKLDRREQALERVRHAVFLDPGYGWAWNAISVWGQQMGQPDLGAEAVRELTRRRPGEVRSWLHLARVLSGPDTFAERQAAVERALELEARSIEAHDQRALLLYQQGNFDEAIAACQPSAWNGQPPAELRARAAWLRAQRGDLGLAIQQLKAVLAEHPGIAWAWKELADWHFQREEWTAAGEAAEQLVRFQPFDPVPLGYAGELKRRAKDFAAARELFQRAFDLDPEYTFAGFALFDLHLNADNDEACREVLRRLKANARDADLQLAELRIALRHNHKVKGMEAVRALCRAADDAPAAFEEAVELLHARGWSSDALAEAERVLAEPAPNPTTGAFCVFLRGRLNRLHNHTLLSQLVGRGELGIRALSAELDLIGAVGSQGFAQIDVGVWLSARFQMLRLLRAHYPLLRSSDWLWGKVGYALTCLKWRRRLLRWFADWRTRKQVEPWMLYNFITQLHAAGNDAEADAVVRHALTLPFRDQVNGRLRLWAALEEILQGRHTEALAFLHGLELDKLPDSDKAALEFLNVLLEYVGPHAACPRFDSPRWAKFKAFLRLHCGSKSLRRAAGRAGKLVAARKGSALLRFCFWWLVAGRRITYTALLILFLGALLT
ncbi:MAG: TPR domain-containing protein [Limisphaerales bacterium]|nr:MAG: TPR domain-containing protein [Limisphaerales bacterium]